MVRQKARGRARGAVLAATPKKCWASAQMFTTIDAEIVIFMPLWRFWGGMAGDRRHMSDGPTNTRPLLGRYPLDGVVRARVRDIAPAFHRN